MSDIGQIERSEKKSALDKFAASAPRESTNLVPTGVFAAPAERVFGAQPVAVHWDEGKILQKLKSLAAAAGDDWYYRYPVRKKVKDERTGREEWTVDHIEGPSIKLANDLARLYGNCDIDTRVFDLGDSWVFYARFMDLETGHALTRPFQQRKAQKALRTDDARALDIAFQIGVSKATRNVIVNALQTFADFAFEEAKNALVEKVGRRLPEYRAKVVERLGEMKVDVRRAEIAVGRVAADWLAPDVARLIAMIKAIGDGMATADETFPPLPAEQPTAEQPPASTDAGSALDSFAAQEQPGSTRQASAKSAGPVGSESSTPAAAPKTTAQEEKPQTAVDPIAVARKRGAEAYRAGHSRKAVPPEYRTPERQNEAIAWQEEFDAARAEDDQRAK